MDDDISVIVEIYTSARRVAYIHARHLFLARVRTCCFIPSMLEGFCVRARNS